MQVEENTKQKAFAFRIFRLFTQQCGLFGLSYSGTPKSEILPRTYSTLIPLGLIYIRRVNDTK